ncbi:CASP-like protein 4B1 [Bienertia sinuspersici]
MQQPQRKEEAPIPRPPGSDVEGGGETPARPEKFFRACALLFSFLSFILMAFVSDFYLYGGFSFVLGVAIVTTAYMAVQVGIKGHELRTLEVVISPRVAVWIDFCGDQFLAYMLLSSATAGATTSVGLRNGYSYATVGLELVAASVSMSIFAFIFLAPATLFSAYRLFANI